MVRGSRPFIVDGAGFGMRLAIAAAAGLIEASPMTAHREAALHRRFVKDRRERRREEDAMRERLLRAKIAEGKDDRDDKYLHAAARRRRQAEHKASSPSLGGRGM